MAIPSDIAGLVRWYKADSLALSDGDPIATWTDSSANSNATAAGTARPTFKTNIVNGKPIARFDGSANTMGFASLALTDCSAFMYLKNTGDGGILGGSGSAPQFRDGQGTNQLSVYDGTNNPFSNTMSPGQGTFSLVEYIHSGTTISWYQDGNALGTGTFIAGMGGSLTQVGAFSTGAVFLNGDIAEVVLYNSALNTTDRQSIEAYFVSRYVPSATVALTGVGGTASPGTLADSTTVAVTGNAATSAVGTLADTRTIALSGNAATASIGSVVPSRTVSITGAAATTAVGTVTGVQSNLTLAITGLSATTAVGSVSIFGQVTPANAYFAIAPVTTAFAALGLVTTAHAAVAVTTLGHYAIGDPV